MSADEKMRTSGEGVREAGSGSSSSAPVLPTVNPEAEKSQAPKPTIPAAAYVIAWISLSSSVIIFNKWILSTLNFRFPVILTTYHLLFATVMTQLLARYTNLIDGRKSVKMTGRVYLRAIVPIGVFFSLSLICGNLTYLYLSVAFIQMLKATTPVAVLLASWAMGVSQPNLKVFLNVMVIVFGVVLASIGEIRFVMTGFLYQLGGIVFEAMRLTMVQRLLSSADFKMDPLVSLYYFAPVCAFMNLVVALMWEVPKVTMADFNNVGYGLFFLNGLCAFLLNVSVVFLIGKTSVLVLTLCGVLKDILLVAASMLIWGTPVTGLQFFGYGIALCGMVYFKLGYDTLKNYAAEGGRKWAEFGATRPALRKIIIGGTVLAAVFLVFTWASPSSIPVTLPVRL
ncbi:uncharacterized protein SPSK_01726 [Sporothrix schenckii 1099-18]|uniref:Sugar phosphate transporter domain-containing protein n=2 Tax=Sporothrix schenckii TaxID=29908 RepID=U7PP45_SPOS1|nr:uncharacterized protein SPSK_01726 [Sporothrix schenckii 1099-18]ERS96280.1 hypothetical protein HMPREF1624_07189 [Sporothrix schenckii ATCC 58251]KJR86983.1 hypothetical protein SPSK_01726 [Sporothrix schenckii 1099-18]